MRWRTTVMPGSAFIGHRISPWAAGLDGLQLPMEDLPGGMGRRFASGLAGTTAVPGVWVAGNATDPTAQLRASAAAGALAGSHTNADLTTADTDAALSTARHGTAHA